MRRITTTLTVLLLSVIAAASILAYAYTIYTSSFIQNFPPPASHFVLTTNGTPLPTNFNATAYWTLSNGNYTMPLTILNDGNATFTPIIIFYPSDSQNWTETTNPAPTLLTIGHNETITIIVTPLQNATTLQLNVVVTS